MMATLLKVETAVALGSLVLLWFLEGIAPFFTDRKGRLRHGARNLSLSLINIALVSLVFSGLTAAVTGWAERAGFGLFHWIRLSPWASTALSVLLIDLWMYAWHRGNHRIPLLWRFHRVHHSDTTMDVTTAGRFHTGEITISSLLRLLVFPLLGVSLWQVVLYETLLVPVIQLHHSNVALPGTWDRLLRLLIVTPNMHRVHHSHLQPETDSNYASIFSFWDRLFGTFRQVRDPHTIVYGLDEWSGDRWQSVPGLLRTPFVAAADSETRSKETSSPYPIDLHAHR